MADEHEKEIAVNANCQFPVPEVICIRSINADVTKEYIPTCTVVFRCRPRSGCCQNGHVCRVRNSSSILRAFWVCTFTTGSQDHELTMDLTMKFSQKSWKNYEFLSTWRTGDRSADHSLRTAGLWFSSDLVFLFFLQRISRNDFPHWSCRYHYFIQHSIRCFCKSCMHHSFS